MTPSLEFMHIVPDQIFEKFRPYVMFEAFYTQQLVGNMPLTYSMCIWIFKWTVISIP